jgi:CheY-like chemotaxis protein
MSSDVADLARGRRILVVEDEYLIAVDLSEALEELGAEVVGPVANVTAALAEIEKVDALDGATLDVTLGQEKSFEVAAALRTRGVPFVFLTGYSDRGVPDQYRDVPTCEKPFDVQTLLKAIFR